MFLRIKNNLKSRRDFLVQSAVAAASALLPSSGFAMEQTTDVPMVPTPDTS